MTDNFNLFRQYLIDNDIENPNVHWRIQILKRRKENPELAKNVKHIKNFYINSIKDYNRIERDIIEICYEHNARAYIDLQAKNPKLVWHSMIDLINNWLRTDLFETDDEYRVAHGMMGLLNDYIRENRYEYLHPLYKFVIDFYGLDYEESKYSRLRNAYDKAFGENRNNVGKTRWILDIDDISLQSKIIIYLKNKIAHLELYETIPTPNGVHFITSGFDNREFKNLFSTVEIKKNNPSILFSNCQLKNK